MEPTLSLIHIYLYTPSGFTAQIEGEGMIFTMPGTVFYGYFKDGKPRGECLALQFINVDSPRYNYSYGIDVYKRQLLRHWNGSYQNYQGYFGR